MGSLARAAPFSLGDDRREAVMVQPCGRAGRAALISEAMDTSTQPEMSHGERLIAGACLKQHFHDAHERRAYLRAVETAKRLADDPTLLQPGRTFAERFMRMDPHLSPYYALWLDLLSKDALSVARSLIEDSEQGALLRDTSPVFVTFTEQELAALWSGAR